MNEELFDDQLLGGMVASIVTGILRRLKPHWQSATVLVVFVLIAATTALVVWAAEIWAWAELAWKAYYRVMAVTLAGLGMHESKRREDEEHDGVSGAELGQEPAGEPGAGRGHGGAARLERISRRGAG